MKFQEHVLGDEIPEGMVSIPLKAGEPDGDRILIPNFDMSKINVTRVVLQMGHPCKIVVAGTRKQRRKDRKPIIMRYSKEVDTVLDLEKLTGMKAGDVVYVKDPELKKNFVFIPAADGVAYNNAWYGVQLVPTVVDGKIKNCEVRLFHDQKVQAAY